MKIILPIEKFYHLINHGPCTLVTSGTEKIKNVAPIAWITPLNDEPPMVIICVASSHYTSKLINKYKEFVINIPNIKMLKLLKESGNVSGSKKDKFGLFDIKYDFGKKTKTVHLKDCIGFIETKLFYKKEFNGVNLYIGKVVHCEVEKEVYKGFLIPNKAKTLHHLGSNNFFVSSKVI